MNNSELKCIVEKLCSDSSHEFIYHVPIHGEPMPSTEMLSEFVNVARRVFFPGYFGNSTMTQGALPYYMGINVETLYRILKEQIKRGICFDCSQDYRPPCEECENTSENIAQKFIAKLPDIRKMLSRDVVAAYNGDPAAKSYGEVIFCYPAIKALTNYRIAHELLKLSVPLIPRIITEMAHSETGIDIHPGAEIGEYFTIDHGTGVVIGETCVIGNNVKIYQGVTLGAKSFPVDENGNPIKGVKRHPTVEDNVVIYAEATILGKVTIGKNSVIGGNVWVTHDVPQNSKILQEKSSYHK